MISIRRVFAILVSGAALFFLGADIALAQGVTLRNPLSSSYDTIPKFISGALKAMVMVALPVISLFIVYSGALFVFARGNEEALSKAKTNFLYVILGSILILGAWVIASVLGSTVVELTK